MGGGIACPFLTVHGDVSFMLQFDHHTGTGEGREREGRGGMDLTLGKC